MVAKKDWSIRLKDWRKRHADQYAEALLSEPTPVTMAKLIPWPGVILIMGSRGMGKTGEAHAISLDFHKRRGIPTVLHLPHAPEKTLRKIKGQLPPWVTTARHKDEWPKGAVVIVDEASQTAHARRTQSGDAVELDNLIGISRQRHQLIIFISHHSRKLDPNVVHEVNQIHWKQPTYAHQLFERDELADFSMKAFDFFVNLRKGRLWRECNKTMHTNIKKSTLILDMDDFRFFTFKNVLPPYWSEDLSRLFQNITNGHKPEKKRVPGF